MQIELAARSYTSGDEMRVSYADVRRRLTCPPPKAAPEPPLQVDPPPPDLMFTAALAAIILEYSGRGISKSVQIKREVCRVFGLSHIDIESDRRTDDLVIARQIAMALCRRFTPDSLPKIGRLFGNRDHTTCLHAVRKLEPHMAAVAVELGACDNITQWATSLRGRLMSRPGAKWQPVPSYPAYRVNSDGQIRHKDNKRVRSLQVTSAGYLAFTCNSGRNKNTLVTVHRAVAEAFLGPCPDGMQVCHVDGVKSNNKASNLRYGTAQDNAADRERHGHTKRGEKNGNAHLSDSDAEQIKLIYAAGDANQYELADRFGVSQAQINNIVLGKQRRPRPQIAT